MRAMRLNLLLIITLSVLSFTTSIFAQDDTPASKSKDSSTPDATTDEGGKPDKKASVKEDDSKQEQAWKNLIYIPYKNFKKVFEEKEGSVLIPYKEYMELLKKVREQVLNARGQALTVSAVITESHYTAKVDGDFSRIHAVLKIQALKASWNEVALKFGNAAIGKIKSSKGEVLLRGAGKGEYRLMLPEKGEYEVEIDLSVKVQTSPDGRSFSFPCPTVGITTLEVSIPKADQSIEIQPQVVAVPVKAEKGNSQVKANLGSTENISVRWSPKTGSKPEMELLTSVTNESHVSISDNLVHKHANLQYEVLRGELSQLELVVPVQDRILDVSSSNARIRQWKLKKEKNSQKITVDLISPVTGKFNIEVHTELALPEKSFSVIGIEKNGAVSGIHSFGAVRENGRLILTHSEELAVTIEDKQGLTRIDQSKIPASLKGANTFSYQFYNPQVKLAISTSLLKPRLIVNQNLQLRIRDELIHVYSQIGYQVERAGIFDVQIEIPEGVEVEAVRGKEVEKFSFDEDSKTVTVNLKKRLKGSFQLTLIGRQPVSEGKKILLPIPKPVGTDRETGLIRVYAPQSIELITNEKELKGVYESAGGVNKRDHMLRSQWAYNHRPVEISVSIKRKPTRLTATVATTVNVQKDLTQVTSTLKYLIENAGVDTFRIAVPESIKDQVQIEAKTRSGQPSIQQKILEKEAKDGWAIWKVKLQREVLGSYVFQVRFDLKRDEKSKDAETISIPRVVELVDEKSKPTLSISRIQGEIAIQKERSLSLSAKLDQGEAEAIDVRELKMLSQSGYQAYRYYSQPVSLVINRSEHAIQEVIKTVVSRSLSEVVIGQQDDQATYRCRYRIQSSERQRLSIWLPTGIEPLGVLLNNKTISLEKNEEGEAEEGWSSYLVNISRDSSSDIPFVLTLQFRLPISPVPFESAGGKLQLRFPRIENEKGKSLSAATMQSRVALWIPDQYSIVGIPEGFIPDKIVRLSSAFGFFSRQDRDTADLDAWFGQGKKGLYDFPQIGHVYRYSKQGGSVEVVLSWWKRSWFSLYISAGVFCIGLILSRTRWQNRFSVIIIACLALALYGLKDHVIIYHFLSAASYGLLATCALWGVDTLFGKKISPKEKPAAPVKDPVTDQPVEKTEVDQAEKGKTDSPENKGAENNKKDEKETNGDESPPQDQS